MALRSDFDSAWKDARDAYFPQFMALLWPDMHAQMDWRRDAVFLDKELQASYAYEYWGCRLHFTFPVTRLEGWRPRMSELLMLAPSNPFAVVILAQLEANATRDGRQRLAGKTALVRHLYHWGFSRDNVIQLFRIIDAMVGLPEALEPAFEDAVIQIEEEKQMSYVTSIERVRRKREQAMMEEGVRRGYWMRSASKMCLPD